MTPEEFSQKIKAKYPVYANMDDMTLAKKMVEKYPQYASQVKLPTTQFKETPINRANKLARYQAEAAQAQRESEKANALLGRGGMAANFGKALVSNLASSEVGLGKTIAKTFGNQMDTYTKAIEDTTTQQVNLLKLIREKKARGEDTTKQEGLYNEGEMQLKFLNEQLAQETNLPTTGKVLGQLGGTALDVFTAGTYGKAAKAMETGKLASKTTPVVAQTVANHLTSSKQILDTLPAEQIAASGGMPAILQRAQTNIVDQLKTQGMANAAKQVGKINPAQFANVDDFARAVQLALPQQLSQAVRGAITAVSPELGAIATQKAGGILTAQGAANIAKGAGIGYGYDVTQGLQGARGEDRTGGAAFIPGAGTALGAAIPTISETVKSVQNFRSPDVKVQKIIDSRSKELDKLDSYSTLSKQIEKGKERGIDIKKMLANTDVLQNAVDDTGRITTRGEGNAIDLYTRQFVDGNEDLVSKALKKEGVSISPQILETRLKKAIDNAGIEGEALVSAQNKLKRELAGYARRANPNGSVPLSVIHDAKIDKYSDINFMTEPQKQKYARAVAETLKEIVEDYTKAVDVKDINRELSKHYSVLGYLEKLDGKRVEGGKLGKYFGQTIGAVVGSHFGPLGAVVGAEAGGRIKGASMARTFKGTTGIKPKEAEAFTKATEYLKKKPLELNP